MKRIPHAREVEKALRSVRTEVQVALRELNLSASQAMGKGDYATGEVLAAKGREIRQYLAELEAVRQRWRDLRGSGANSPNNPAKPLWTYYQPILKALVDAGGESDRKELEPRVLRLLEIALQPQDRVLMAGGRERWQVMVRRARKHLVAEGWIEDTKGAVWRITEAGRGASTSLQGKSTLAK
jgi:hypothetical protein